MHSISIIFFSISVNIIEVNINIGIIIGIMYQSNFVLANENKISGTKIQSK